MNSSFFLSFNSTMRHSKAGRAWNTFERLQQHRATKKASRDVNENVFLFCNFRKSYNNIIKRWLFTSLYYRKLDFYRSDWLSDNFYCRLTVSLLRRPSVIYIRSRPLTANCTKIAARMSLERNRSRSPLACHDRYDITITLMKRSPLFHFRSNSEAR